MSDGTDVDTKCRARETFGNDANAGTGVDTNYRDVATFGNDGVGFIRVRKRQVKGGHLAWRSRDGALPTKAMSFDLGRAVRVDGKPRHRFVLGLGSQKDVERNHPCWFWVRAVHRMVKHGLAEGQRQRLITEMVRKGARLPSIAQCEDHARIWAFNQAAVIEIIDALKAQRWRQ